MLSILEGYSFREERRDVHIWNPNPTGGVFF